MSIYDAFMFFMGTFDDFICSADSAYFLFIPLTFALVLYLCFVIKSFLSKKE